MAKKDRKWLVIYPSGEPSICDTKEELLCFLEDEPEGTADCCEVYEVDIIKEYCAETRRSIKLLPMNNRGKKC